MQLGGRYSSTASGQQHVNKGLSVYPPNSHGQQHDSCGQRVEADSGWWRHWCHWLANWASMRCYVLVRQMPPSTTTDSPGAHWCPDPGFGGDPPGLPAQTHPEPTQTLSRVLTGTQGAAHTTETHYDLDRHAIFILGVILDPALDGLMILVFTDCYVILLYTLNLNNLSTTTSC